MKIIEISALGLFSAIISGAAGLIGDWAWWNTVAACAGLFCMLMMILAFAFKWDDE